MSLDSLKSCPLHVDFYNCVIMKIVFIGAGNLATHLSQALSKAGHDIVQVYSRTKDAAHILARKIGAT